MHLFNFNSIKVRLEQKKADEGATYPNNISIP